MCFQTVGETCVPKYNPPLGMTEIKIQILAMRQQQQCCSSSHEDHKSAIYLAFSISGVCLEDGTCGRTSFWYQRIEDNCAFLNTLKDI